MTSFRSVRTAMEVLRWALAFYREHLFLIVAISLVPAVHRFIFVLWGWDFPSVVLEALVGGVRFLLISVIIWIAIYRDDELDSVSDKTRQRRVEAFFSAEWPSLIVQFALLAGMVVIFNFVLEQVVVQWIPPDLKDVYLASLLAAKNLTVIAFTMIWMVGIVRQMLLYTPDSVGKSVHKTV